MPLATATTSEAPSLPLSLPIDYIFPREFETGFQPTLRTELVASGTRGGGLMERDRDDQQTDGIISPGRNI